MKDRCRQPVYELIGPFRYRSEDGAKDGRRTCDDPQYLRCCRLALEGLSKLQFERIEKLLLCSPLHVAGSWHLLTLACNGATVHVRRGETGLYTPRCRVAAPGT